MSNALTGVTGNSTSVAAIAFRPANADDNLILCRARLAFSSDLNHNTWLVCGIIDIRYDKQVSPDLSPVRKCFDECVSFSVVRISCVICKVSDMLLWCTKENQRDIRTHLFRLFGVYGTSRRNLFTTSCESLKNLSVKKMYRFWRNGYLGG